MALGMIVQNRPDLALQARFAELCRTRCVLGLYGSEIALCTNRPQWLDRLLGFFPISAVRPGSSLPSAAPFYFVYDAGQPHPYRVMNPSGRYAAADRWGAVLPFLVSTTYAHIWSRANDLLPLHSACVAHDNRAILFPAVSGGGKTTFVLELLQRGFPYLSDEFAPLRLGSERVLAAPRPLQVSTKTVKALMGSEAPAILAQEGIRDDRGELRYLVQPGGPDGPEALDQAYEVSHIIAPVLGEKPVGQWEPWRKVEALAWLASSALVYGHDAAWREQAVATLVRVIKSARCYRFYLGPIGENAPLLETLLAQEEQGLIPEPDPETDALDEIAERAKELLST